MPSCVMNNSTRFGRVKAVVAAALSLTLVLSTPSAAQDDGICSSGSSAQSGCIAYEHRDFEGRSQPLGPNRHFSYVGDRLNDEISSFRVSQRCHVVVWEHRDKGGASRRFDECQYIGNDWNDAISSWSCRCN
jgi:hypothetical protein